MFRVLTPLLFCLATGGSLAHAAEAASITFRAVCFDPRETATPAFFVGAGGARKPLDLDKSRLSDSQQAPVRDGRMVDFFATKDPVKGEKPAVTVTLPAELPAHVLFVFAPAPTGHKAWAIPLPPDDFPAGGTLLVNATPQEIAIRAGDAKSVNILPARHQFLKIPASLKDDMMPVQIFEKNAASKAWQVAQSTRWAVDLRFRSYVFFYQGANGRLMLHGVTERL